ncbi:hypothetical protein [Pseudoalteromonas marina]|jgi:hypothetical protein|uniref:hypothetical protein n=1 Tax=Pseudoalteromonas marina TaxID=267375 RepID=UPI00304AA14E
MSKHNEHSTYREKLIEHLFVGELLKLSWLDHECGLEVAKPEVDNSGYDIIAECYGVVRHIQLKASHTSSSTTQQKVHIKLTDKPSGCMVWIIFDEDSLAFKEFLFYGDQAGEPLPSIDNLKVAKHAKGNKDGVKNERPNIRVINKGQFEPVNSMESLFHKLFCMNQSETSDVALTKQEVQQDNSTLDDFTKLNRIKIWSHKPWQKNHQLIKGFLELESSSSFVDFDLLIEFCSTKFDGAKGEWKNNFNSMKTDLGNAHGKIFFTDGNKVKVYNEARNEIDKFTW